ncbi:MAG: hypothetical protein EOP11_03510 [Proteobacteria bacterium]|nr:MAG: hypothetical protein EOP11_03510 [Pseudomonadota bacterium]
MKSILLSFTILISSFTASRADAGYYIYVCGAAFSQADRFFSQAAGQAQARGDSLRQCREEGGRACREIGCQRVFQPTKVSELPPARRRELNRRLAKIPRENSRATARKNDDFENSAMRALDEVKRRQREDDINKAIEFTRACQTMSGCPTKL